MICHEAIKDFYGDHKQNMNQLKPPFCFTHKVIISGIHLNYSSLSGLYALHQS